MLYEPCMDAEWSDAAADAATCAATFMEEWRSKRDPPAAASFQASHGEPAHGGTRSTAHHRRAEGRTRVRGRE